MPISDVARFSPTDPSALVAAAFCCPFCLGEPARVELRGEADGLSDARCTCERCDAEWAVVLDTWQSVRMTLLPPPELALS